MNNQVSGIRLTDKSTLKLPEGFLAGEVMLEVHFRLDTPSYRKQDGHPTFDDDDREAFRKDVDVFFNAIGYVCREGSGGARYYFGEYGELFAHPDDFSGALPLSEIFRIHELLQNREGTFRSRGFTDVCNAFEIVEADEVIKRLGLAKSQIEITIFENLKTNKKSLYYGNIQWDKFAYKNDGFSFHREKSHSALIYKFVHEIALEMTAKGLLKAQTSGQGLLHYRSANKSEIKPTKSASKSVNLNTPQSALLF